MSKSEDSILELTTSIESIGTSASLELDYQGKVLEETDSTLSKASAEIDEAAKQLSLSREFFKNLCFLIKKCLICSCKKKQKVEIFEEEKHLKKEEIDELWCKRFDPNETWLQQVELGLDRLIRMAEAMEKMLSHQEKQSKKMAQKTSQIQNKTRKTRANMESMRMNVSTKF